MLLNSARGLTGHMSVQRAIDAFKVCFDVNDDGHCVVLGCGLEGLCVGRVEEISHNAILTGESYV